MHIHGLIFKELIKRGYSLDGNTRIWNIADSKLWYITPEQAQAYLNLDLNPTYKRFSGQGEAQELIHNNIKDIVKSIEGESFNIIDLGCGNGTKTAFLIQEIHKLNSDLKMRYCPVDISGHMVGKAIETFKKLNFGELIRFHYNISDFDNLENITPLLRNNDFKTNVLLLFGNTLDNFEIHELLYTIRTSMRKGDVFILDTAINDHHQKERVESYVSNKQFYEWLIPVPLQLGLSKDDVEFHGRFRNSRIELYFSLNKDKTVTFNEKSVNFNKGDQIVVVTAYKYEKDTLREFLNMHFDNVTFRVAKNNAKILAICTR
jgi:uncharacterized SAM-dependent methyltransferase